MINIMSTKGSSKRIPWDKIWEKIDEDYKKIFPKKPKVIIYRVKLIEKIIPKGG